jgi:hypothetical protein
MTFVYICVFWLCLCLALKFWRDRDNKALEREIRSYENFKEIMKQPPITATDRPKSGKINPEILINVFSQTHWGQMIRDYNNGLPETSSNEINTKSKEEKVINPVLGIQDNTKIEQESSK